MGHLQETYKVFEIHARLNFYSDAIFGKIHYLFGHILGLGEDIKNLITPNDSPSKTVARKCITYIFIRKPNEVVYKNIDFSLK